MQPRPENRLVYHSLVSHQGRTHRRITLELVMIDGVTDRTEDVEALLEWTRPLSVMVNLIPWNPVPEIAFRESPP